MGIWEGIFLGIVQGLTEFLPVSSSGHLVIFQGFLGVKQPGVFFEVMLHFGTLLSVLWVFGSDLVRVATHFTREKKERHFAVMLLLGIIPTGVMGLLFKDVFMRFYESTLATGVLLLVTGCILYTLCCITPGKKHEGSMTAIDALVISVAQGLAILPGISRSGSTITSALWRGLDKETAVRFSFLVTIPVILGATVLELRDMGGQAALTGGVIYGTIAAFIAGVFAIKVFIRLLQAGRFHYFAYYCWFAGTATIILTLAGR